MPENTEFSLKRLICKGWQWVLCRTEQVRQKAFNIRQKALSIRQRVLCQEASGLPSSSSAYGLLLAEALHSACPKASTGFHSILGQRGLRMSSPPTGPKQAILFRPICQHLPQMTPHAVTLFLPISTHWETGDTCPGGKSIGSQDQIEAFLFSPKQFQLRQMLYLLQLPSNFLYFSCI